MRNPRDIRLSYMLSVEHKQALEESINSAKLVKFNPFENESVFDWKREYRPHYLPFIYPEYPVKFIPELDYKLLVNENWIAEPKYNGWRILIYHDKEGIRFYSRKGKLHNIRVDVDIPEGCILDTELIAVEGKIPSTHNRVNSFIARHPDKLMFVVFDILYFEYMSVMSEPLRQRKRLLQQLNLKHPLKLIEIVDTSVETFKRLINSGYEGLVLKCLDSPYETDGANWLKIKSLDDLEEAWNYFHWRR